MAEANTIKLLLFLIYNFGELTKITKEEGSFQT
jgi:hypothetical protein